MMTRLKLVINKLTQAGQQEIISQADIKLASVVLLVEVMMADHQIDEKEKQQLLSSTAELLETDQMESEALINQAISQHDDLVSLYDLTRTINQHFDQDKKLELLNHMWRVAYSDLQWDKYEEYLIRKVADLLYISHQDFVHARIQVQTLFQDKSS